MNSDTPVVPETGKQISEYELELILILVKQIGFYITEEVKYYCGWDIPWTENNIQNVTWLNKGLE